MNGFEDLEAAVQAAVEQLGTLRSELAQARSRRDEVEGLLRKMTKGEESPAHMAEKLKALEAENADLRARLEEGRAAAERLLARVNYLQAHG